MSKLKIYLDGAELNQMIEASKDSKIAGFTANPTLRKKSGISDYEAFAREVIEKIPDKPVSFEVFSDELNEMEKEARIINSWGGNTYIKIPIMNTKGESTCSLINKLSNEGF